MRRIAAIPALLAATTLNIGCASVSVPSLLGFTGSGGNASADHAIKTSQASASAPATLMPKSQHAVFSFLGSENTLNERKPAAAQKHRTPKAQPPPHNFLIKPVASGRLTSGHGYRINPLSAKPKKHNGIDYAAARGTKVFAAGAGIVEHMYRSSSYGNYIRLRHADGYATAYAHLNHFAPGIKMGSIVKQGQTIGAVGSTGQSTGPHLHFELIHKGRSVDPLSNRLPTELADASTNLDRLVKN